MLLLDGIFPVYVAYDCLPIIFIDSILSFVVDFKHKS